jgi:isochorismate synthase
MNPSTSPIVRVPHSEKECFDQIAMFCVRQSYAYSVWQGPGESIRHFIIDTSGTTRYPDLPLEELSPGFVVAPFDRQGSKHHIKAVHHFTSLDTLQEVKNTLFAKLPSPQSGPRWHSGPEVPATPESNFSDHVSEALKRMESGVLQKVVLSRSKNLPLSGDFDLLQTFSRLCEATPNALVSLVSIPGVGTWLGATPEVLVQVNNDNEFSTAALAGTQHFVPGTDVKTVAWTQKEIEEQAYVSRYIVNCFKKIRLREFDEVGPRTVVAGNLLHLKTDYTVNMQEVNFPQLGSVMLDLLHPTSAVCGMPMEESLAFIRKTEGYERGFYAGYLGPVKVTQPIQLYVNLRCLQLSRTAATLYAGAGITAYSDPEKEFLETELKMDTLLKLL